MPSKNCVLFMQDYVSVNHLKYCHFNCVKNRALGESVVAHIVLRNGKYNTWLCVILYLPFDCIFSCKLFAVL